MFVLNLALAVLVSTRQAVATTNVFGTFSRFEVDRSLGGSGDISGYEIVVLPGIDHPNVVFQCAVGDVEQPILVAAKLEDQGLSFDVPTNNLCPGHFVARVSGNSLTLTSGASVIHLKRGTSFWLHRAKTR